MQRALSSSYAPDQSDGNYLPLVEDLRSLFDRYAEDGQLRMPNYTAFYWGVLE